jgi:DNA polymerase-4
MDLDTFFVSVERLMNSHLQGKPVIIGGMSDRGVVSSCSYEARSYGVHSAMPMKMARQLCSDGIYIRGDMETYSRYSRTVTEIIAESAPVYEKASIDEHYLDISGLDRFFGCLIWSHELRQRIIRETGLPISFGLSVNKTVSKIATGIAKPNGEKEVPEPEVRNFLAPLSIDKIPMLGPKTFQLLRSMGVLTIKTLSEIPPTPVEPYWEQKSISSERTFEQDTTDVNDLNRNLITMVEKIAFELRKQEKITACVTVKIRYANFDTHTIQKRIPYTSFDHILIPIVQELFKKLYTRRMLVRLIGVRLSELVHGTQQLNLFEDTPESVNLYLAMDKLRMRYGSDSVKRAIGIRKG